VWVKCRDSVNAGGLQIVIIVVLRADSPGKAAQWLARSIRRS
jgi:hypothetical protein